MTRNVLFAGGGTAGHVFPAVAVAQELQRVHPDVQPIFVGTKDRLEGRLVPEAGYELHHINVLSLPRRPSPSLLRVPGALRGAVRRCVEVIEEIDAKAVVTFGGFVSLPAAMAARRLGLPLIVHEQNAVPGLANRLAARWADRVAITFPGSADRFVNPERTVVTGNPVREAILQLDRDAEREKAARSFRLRWVPRNLLVFGGSQGARSLNRAIADTFGQWDGEDVQILHATGLRLYSETAALWEQARTGGIDGPRVRCVDFIDDMDAAYAVADIVVCRAGATSIAELTALGIPAVLVPYPHATADHQLHNARALAQCGAAVLIEDRELSGARLVEAVRPWLEDEDALRRASRAAKAFGRPDAAANVARLVSEHLPDANGAADSREPAASTTIAKPQGKRLRKRRRS
ncbi:MAG: UDP-N-acetylglucosamine--N-acetylmuramyl-(pentapeptide) pyrophosphoryl-undecaprenol N-acetylglucosamine transferase [Glaciecola sp.]|jgi:UDP-N-acetylglucosamine--N-acetylmuramyl-(pentapeptide) pyrophosphoryl-undecaprenol N-acetylglucosamine transferase